MRHEKTELVQSISTNSELDQCLKQLVAFIDSTPICRVRQAFAQPAQALQTHGCRGWLGRATRSDSEPLLKTSERRGAEMSGMARRAEAGARKCCLRLKRQCIQASAAEDRKVQQRRLRVSYMCCGLCGPRRFSPPAAKRLSRAPALPPASADCGSCGSACAARSALRKARAPRHLQASANAGDTEHMWLGRLRHRNQGCRIAT